MFIQPPDLVPLRVLGEQGGFRYLQARWCPVGRPATEVFVKELLCPDDQSLRARLLHEGCVMRHLPGGDKSKLAKRGRLPPVGTATGIVTGTVTGTVRCLAHSELYLVFEWLPGESLRARLERGDLLSAAQARQLLREVLRSLEQVHTCGVVHHDLKPENVMLPPGWPQGGAATLIDFGLAYDRRQPHDLYAGMGVGTPPFMPPEQFRGVRGDPRSDLYAACALLFEALAGQPPFCNALGWLTGTDTRRLPLPGPPDLQQLLDWGLQRDPTQRPQYAAQLLEGLGAVPPAACAKQGHQYTSDKTADKTSDKSGIKSRKPV